MSDLTPNDAQSPSSLSLTIVLVGFMGTGKTTIGRRLADRVGLPFIDTDALVVERAGIGISELFRMHGEPAFRQIEREVLAGLEGGLPSVVSTGGGLPVDPANRERLRRLGFVVWLRTSEPEILRRVSRNRDRPLMQVSDPAGTLRRLLAERTPSYKATAHWVLDTTRLPVAVAVRRILEAARRFQAGTLSSVRTPEVGGGDGAQKY